MCFVDSPDTPEPSTPPEVLKQSAPAKKTAAQPSRGNMLSIGTKKYRNEKSIGTPLALKKPSDIA